MPSYKSGASLPIGYNDQATKEIITIQQKIDEHISANFKMAAEGHQGYWTTSASTALSDKANKQETEMHQEKIRRWKQEQTNVSQQSFIELVDSAKTVVGWEQQNNLIVKEYYKIWPLVQRRKNQSTVFTEIVKSSGYIADGELFTFSDPVDIKTDYLYCNCGQFPLPPDQMLPYEQEQATEHLAVCQHIRSESLITRSSPANHKIGHWDCNACYKTQDGKSNIDWCPRFIRPFRQMTPKQYKNVTISNEQDKSCYAGLLHHQISIDYKDNKQFVIRTSKCDTCNYEIVDSKEISTPDQNLDKHQIQIGNDNSQSDVSNSSNVSITVSR